MFEADFREAPPPPAMPQGLSMPSLDPELWHMVEGTARGLGLDAVLKKLPQRSRRLVWLLRLAVPILQFVERVRVGRRRISR